MKTCKLFINYAGYCLAKANHAVNGDENTNIKFHAMFGLIQHPEKGWILFDTGYTDRFFKATSSYPNKFYALITQVTIEKKEEVKQLLNSYGILPEDIKHIIVSHFHADHIGGLKDFENATIYCSKTSYNQVKNTSNFFAFSKGILKFLLPHNIEKRLKFFETNCNSENDEIFGKRYDLFNDGSIYVYELPGHAAGQIGIYLQTKKAEYFLIADACWDERAYKIGALPNPIVRLFFDSWKDYKNSILKIKRFYKNNPNVIIVPTHCQKATKPLLQLNFNIDAL